MASNLAYAVQAEEEETFSATSGAEIAAQAENAPVLLHVRFRPDATVMKIDYCPADLSPEEWFKRLCARAGDKYAARAGGRGFFRLTAVEIEALKAERH
jgi:hypothetical protein